MFFRHSNLSALYTLHFDIFSFTARCVRHGKWLDSCWWNLKWFIEFSGSKQVILISNFRRVLNVVRFLLGNSPASEFYMPTFRNTLFHFHRRIGMKNPSYLSAYEDGTDCKWKSNLTLGGVQRIFSCTFQISCLIWIKFGVSEVKWTEVNWSELRWSSWGHKYHVHYGDLILMVPDCIVTISFNVSCTVFVTTCFVMCGCVYVWVFW